MAIFLDLHFARFSEAVNVMNHLILQRMFLGFHRTLFSLCDCVFVSLAHSGWYIFFKQGLCESLFIQCHAFKHSVFFLPRLPLFNMSTLPTALQVSMYSPCARKRNKKTLAYLFFPLVLIITQVQQLQFYLNPTCLQYFSPLPLL